MEDGSGRLAEGVFQVESVKISKSMRRRWAIKPIERIKDKPRYNRAFEKNEEKEMLKEYLEEQRDG